MRTLALALGVVCALLMGSPAGAAAETWAFDYNNAKLTTHSGSMSLTSTSGDHIRCATSTGTGEYDAGSKTTGKISFILTGCVDVAVGVNCSSGATSGRIDTKALTFHNVFVNKHGFKVPGILLKPASGTVLAHFTCKIFGFGPTVEWRANGLAGEFEGTCGLTANSAGANFVSASAGHPTITRLWNTGGEYIFTSHRDGSSSSASEDWTYTITAHGTPTC